MEALSPAITCNVLDLQVHFSRGMSKTSAIASWTMAQKGACGWVWRSRKVQFRSDGIWAGGRWGGLRHGAVWARGDGTVQQRVFIGVSVDLWRDTQMQDETWRLTAEILGFEQPMEVNRVSLLVYCRRSANDATSTTRSNINPAIQIDIPTIGHRPLLNTLHMCLS